VRAVSLRRPGLVGFILGCLTSVAFAFLSEPFAAGAQQAAPARVIGYLGNSDARTGAPYVEAFRQGLRDLGWIEGKTVRIEHRWAEGSVDRLSGLVSELVRLKVDVLVVSGVPALRAAQEATRTIPIVMGAVLIDPVSAGFVKSLAQPGGNITGVASQYEDIVTKQVQLLSEIIPKLSRLFVLRHTSSPPITANASAAAAGKLGIKVRLLEVNDVAEYEGAFRTAQNAGGQAIHVLPSPVFNAHRHQLIDLAARYRLPAAYEFREYVQDGGLFSYGPSVPEMARGAASYVDRIFKGAKAGDLPIERPTKFELIINLRTAKALGLTMPPSLLLRADEIVQ
jgi:putative ABC transport system substrate-binding protein